MNISFDPAKRRKTLEERDLDFLDSPRLFAGPHFSVPDDRQDYGEERWISFGKLGDRNVAIVWTEREDYRRIISMRYMHDDEIRARQRALD